MISVASVTGFVFLNIAAYTFSTAQFPNGKYNAKNKAILRLKFCGLKILSTYYPGKHKNS